MERIDKIMTHKLFGQCMAKIEEAERERVYCRHHLAHALDVARIAYILNLEEHGPLAQDVIYAMALLHDLGRSVEYETGTSHHEAGAELAMRILPECGFTRQEVSEISKAISGHQYAGQPVSFVSAGNVRANDADQTEDTADYAKSLLFRADKLSRNCYDCLASKTCYWDEDQKNNRIIY